MLNNFCVSGLVSCYCSSIGISMYAILEKKEDLYEGNLEFLINSPSASEIEQHIRANPVKR